MKTCCVTLALLICKASGFTPSWTSSTFTAKQQLAAPRVSSPGLQRAAAVTTPSFFQTTRSANTIATASRKTSIITSMVVELPMFAKILSPTPSRIANKNLVVITGASSGLGRETARELLLTKGKAGKYHVVMACRDVKKAERVATELGFPKTDYTIMELELANFASVRKFVKNLMSFKGSKPLDTLICNAAVYLPNQQAPTFSDDGIEMSLQVNHLGHFLLANLLLKDMAKAKKPKMCIVGSITGNTNTVGGGVVYPRANLGKFKGWEKGMKKPVSMVDGGNFNGAKAYKDAKLCNMMTMLELHERYHDSTGIIFSSMYPGCIAETALFRQKRQWFRSFFPVFMKYVTGGYVSQKESGERLAQIIDDPQCEESGNYWSWNGGAKTVGFKDLKTGEVVGAGGAGGEIFKNTLSGDALDIAQRKAVWDLSAKTVGLA